MENKEFQVTSMKKGSVNFWRINHGENRGEYIENKSFVLCPPEAD